MRIGIFTDQYFTTMSGVVTSIKTLASGLRKLVHTVYIITSINLNKINSKNPAKLNLEHEFYINIPGHHYFFKNLRGYRFVKAKKNILSKSLLLS